VEIINLILMKKYKYIGNFRSIEGYEYELEVYCNGTIQAFFLLIAEAIKSGKHYQLNTITDEKGNVYTIDDINKVGDLINANNMNKESQSRYYLKWGDSPHNLNMVFISDMVNNPQEAIDEFYNIYPDKFCDNPIKYTC